MAEEKRTHTQVFKEIESDVAGSPSAQIILKMCREALLEHLIRAKDEGKSMVLTATLFMERVFVAGAEWERFSREAIDPKYEAAIFAREGMAERMAKDVVARAAKKENGDAA